MSSLGLELLALTGREGARHVLHEVRIWSIPPRSTNLLLTLASLATEQITELWSGIISCTSDEGGTALISILERCTMWSVMLELGDGEGGVGEKTWQRLAREVARGPGRLRWLSAEREVVRRGSREDVRAVWKSVETTMWVDRETIEKSDGEEEGWFKIEELIE